MKLQDAIDTLETTLDELRQLLKVEPSGVADMVLDAARRVANLNWKAATDVLEHALPSLGGSRTESGMTVIEIVHAALGITEDINGD